MRIPTILALALGLCFMTGTAGAADKIRLSDNWRVQSAAVAPEALPDSTWYKAKVPSTAMAVLMDNGVYPANLLDGNSYRNVDRSQFDSPWWWVTDFALPPLADGQHAALELDGISYRADVYVNGKLVASADSIMGPFRRHTIDITPYVKTENRLALKVRRAQPGEPNIGFVDWNPRPADESMGVFRPVTVHVSDRVALSSPAVKSKINKNTLGEAWLTVEATLTNTSATSVSGTLRGSFDGRDIKKAVTLAPGETRTVTVTPQDAPELHVLNPRLWWCRNMGSPEMYGMQLTFTDDQGRVYDSDTVRFGIREIEDYLTSDNQRGFRLNGRPVLLRGAGWTDDIFLRNDSARNEIEAAYVADMNLNTVRFENIWGTSQDIYDLCDSLGLMVLTGWSCQWEWENYIGSPCDEYGGIRTEQDMNLIDRSLGDQVAWLRNHPSIIAWFVGSDMIPRPELEQRYRRTLARLDDRPCVTAAKDMTSDISGPSGTKMAGPYDYVSPSYWYDPKAPGGNFGWNTETGIGAQMPQRESVLRMIPADSIWPVSTAYDYHCTKAKGMDNLDNLTDAINGHYGRATDFEDFIRKAELVNYEGTRTMFEAFRAGIPRATGLIQWMLNSAWPSLYWQLYDHYLVPTSAYYSVKKSNQPVQLVYDYGKHAVVAVNETAGPVSLNASLIRYRLNDSEPYTRQSVPVSVEPYTVVKVADIERPDDLDFLFLSLTDDTGREIADNFYVLTADESVNDYEHSEWYMTKPTHYASYKNLDKLAPTTVKVDSRRDGDTLHVTLANLGKTVAFFNRLAAKDSEGELIAPAFWSDNYLTLRPGETRTVNCRLPASAPDVVLTLDGWNLAPSN